MPEVRPTPPPGWRPVMYVFRVLLMYLTPFAAGGFGYAMTRSLAGAAVVTMVGLGVTVWRRESEAAMWRAAVNTYSAAMASSIVCGVTRGAVSPLVWISCSISLSSTYVSFG